MGKIQAIIFDKDGTLFDFQRTWSRWAMAVLDDLSEGDTGTRQRLSRAMGFDLAASRFLPESIVIAETPEVIAAELVPLLGGRRDAAGIVSRLNLHAQAASQVPAVDLREFLFGLRETGVFLGLATNDSEAAARVHLAGAGVLDAFDFVAGYDSGHGAKPGPGQLLAFASHVDVAPADAAMVGDSAHDMQAARAADMAAVAVLTGTATRDDLAPFSDVVLPDVGHLRDWLASR